MSKPIDITGKRFGRLVVLGREGKTDSGKTLWKCQCDCGRITYSQRSHLGKSKNSCGCIRREVTAERSRKHGGTNERLYKIWKLMRERCSATCGHKDYYGRGITICDEWEEYANFRDWAFANGYDPAAERGEKTIDRIDNDKGYSPDNCRFVPMKVQSRNRRTNHLVMYKGKTMPLAAWAEELGTGYSLIKERLKRGWSIDDAFSIPRLNRVSYKRYIKEHEGANRNGK